MAEILVRYQLPVRDANGLQYEARAYGAAIDHVLWEGWIEFVPIGGGPPLRSPRETTQPNRVDTVYWATGLTRVYLEGALIRAVISTLSGRGSASRQLRQSAAGRPFQYHTIRSVAGGSPPSSRRRVAFWPRW
jgi:hypothetical protein